jgi:anti-sigma factor RsiW
MNEAEQHEIDDELLSAYLDDELSTEDRALVEDRLAADPAARQTLEHLRSVSQSVRDLPTESIGHDLSDAILKRAAEARAARPQSPAPSPQLPSVTIGRTTRGWVWASAAIAAAVLIMVLQPNDERRADLPDIAQKFEPRTEAPSPHRHLAESQPKTSALESDGSPVIAAPAPPTAASSAEAQHSAADEVASYAAAPSSEPAMASGQLEAGQVKLQPPSDAHPELPLAAAPPNADQPTGGTLAATTQPVVVRVLAKRTAVENKAFESLLQKHGVDVVSTANGLDTEAAGGVGGPAPAATAREKSPADARSNEESKTENEQIVGRKQKTPEDDSIELLLVDAPSSTIFSCMSALNSDADNYVGISVDDASLTDKTQVDANVEENKPASGLVRFNRGPVPSSHESLAEARHFYDYLGDDVARRQSQQEYVRSGGSSEAKDLELNELEQRAFGAKDGANRGRALRLPFEAIRKIDSLKAVSDGAAYGVSSATVPKSDRLRINQPAEATAPDLQRMQVLFVIRPTDEPSPSLKAKIPAQ